MMSPRFTPPVFINSRDQVTSLKKLVAWLETAGCDRIVILDNQSSYPPLLEFYESTPHRVIHLTENVGPDALWKTGTLEAHCPDGRYVYTDPDVVPIEACPVDAIERLNDVLDRHPDLHKVGLGLYLDDLPDHYAHKPHVLAWEEKFWTQMIEPEVYAAPVATTFAVYRGRGRNDESSARTGYPYVARHCPWYSNSASLTDEERYYQDHAKYTIWTKTKLDPQFERKV